MIRAMARGVSRSVLLALGCGWLGAGTQPDDMSAEAHRREAKEHFREKAEHRERYDPEARDVYSPPWYGVYPYGYRYGYRDNDFYWDIGEYNPTAIHLRHAAEHERRAREHFEATRGWSSRCWTPATSTSCADRRGCSGCRRWSERQPDGARGRGASARTTGSSESATRFDEVTATRLTEGGCSTVSPPRRWPAWPSAGAPPAGPPTSGYSKFSSARASGRGGRTPT